MHIMWPKLNNDLVGFGTAKQPVSITVYLLGLVMLQLIPTVSEIG